MKCVISPLLTPDKVGGNWDIVQCAYFRKHDTVSNSALCNDESLNCLVNLNAPYLGYDDDGVEAEEHGDEAEGHGAEELRLGLAPHEHEEPGQEEERHAEQNGHDRQVEVLN